MSHGDGVGPIEAKRSERAELWVELALDFPRSAASGERAQVEAPLDAAVRADWLKLAALHGQARVGIACWAVLLYRHTRQSNLTVSVHTGAAAGTIPILLSDESSFDALLTQLQAQPNATSRSNVAFVSGVALPPGYDLALTIDDDDGELRARLDYDAGLFRRERMLELLAQLRRLSLQLMAAPSQNILEASLITEAARALLPDPSQPLAQPVHPLVDQAVRAWAERTPNQVAISHAGKTWTYAELAHNAQCIAGQLAPRVARGDVVAVTGPRSFGLVSAMLGVWESGAVLLTLDPKLPLDRRRLMLETAQAKLVLFAGPTDCAEPLAAEDRPVFSIASLSSPPPSAPRPIIEPESNAYVFFTSGSTGTPKAVLGRHKGLAHFLAWQREEFAVGPGDRASQLTALSFDVVLRDMFLALTSGATLCIPNEADALDPEQILRWLARERVTVLHVVPSLARLWLSHVPADLELARLRCAFFAGEPLLDVLVERFRAVFGRGVTIVNLYGPTETTLAKCFSCVGDPPDAGVQSIGRPLPQTQVLILNPSRGLCGLNEVGEMAIRTPFRTAGYLGQPEANARAFVPNPFRNDPEDLIYRTGDSGYYRSDGRLAILGRIDNQVKIRGVRIEPAEIEAALAHQPSVRAAAVVACDDGNAGKLLVAYVVLQPSAAKLEPRVWQLELRLALRARLPEVMVPSGFVRLDALPLNPNGKLDKRALPAFERAAVSSEESATWSARERELAEIWQEVLGVPSVGRDESFFDLGGDSLTAIRVIIRMRVLGFDEALCGAILQGKTVAAIASEIDAGELGAAPQLTAAKDLTPSAHMRLLLNVVRGLLVLLVIVNHFTPSLARRSALVAAGEKYLYPLYNLGTPGFAIAFGVTLGYVYLPQYHAQPERARSLLWRGAVLVGIAAALFGGVGWAMAWRHPELPRDHPLGNVLSYYFLALASADLWFRLIAGSRHVVRRSVALGVSSGLVHHVLQRLSFSAHARDWLVLVLGKFGYFGLSLGALFGVALGTSLKRSMRVSRSYLTLGAALIGSGALLSLNEDVSQAWLSDSEGDIEAWKWLFYGGVLIWLLVLVDRSIVRLPSSGPAQSALRLLGIFGQLALPLFILHFFVRYLGDICTAAGAPPAIRFTIEFGALFVLTYLMVRRTYRLFYGGASAIRARERAFESSQLSSPELP